MNEYWKWRIKNNEIHSYLTDSRFTKGIDLGEGWYYMHFTEQEMRMLIFLFNELKEVNSFSNFYGLIVSEPFNDLALDYVKNQIVSN